MTDTALVFLGIAFLAVLPAWLREGARQAREMDQVAEWVRAEIARNAARAEEFKQEQARRAQR